MDDEKVFSENNANKIFNIYNVAKANVLYFRRIANPWLTYFYLFYLFIRLKHFKIALCELDIKIVS